MNSSANQNLNQITPSELPSDLFIPPNALEICLETFTGPLDLLWYLIKKQNIDILDLEIAKITDQYIEYIDLMESLNFELAAEYLVMAATLAEIKSKMLLPPIENDDETEEDPRVALIERLKQYKIFKEAAGNISSMPLVNDDFYVASAGRPKVQKIQKVINFDSYKLAQVMQEVLERPKLKDSHKIDFEELSTQDRIEFIFSILSKKNLLGFYKTLRHSEGKIGVVVSFLAALELAKNGYVDLIQNESREIYIKSKIIGDQVG